jgi:hypothetical protein
MVFTNIILTTFCLAASVVSAQNSDVIVLTEKNFDVSKGSWLVEFYAVSLCLYKLHPMN